MTHPAAPTFDDVLAAAARIAPFAIRTPVVRSDALDELTGARVYLKCEHLQVTGSFKYRGATNAVRSLDEADAARGVATHSSGNHGQALAKAAAARDIPCHVVMPHNSVQVKLSAVRALGASVHLCEPTMAAREAGLERVLGDTGATAIHPFADPRVIAGQGTAALELLEEVPAIDVIVTPVGGGGLISGTAIAAHGVRESIRIVGGEPEGARDAYDSLATGERVTHHAPNTICDGLRGTLAPITFSALTAHDVRIALVSDDQVRAAMRVLGSVLNEPIEPSGAAALAALMSTQSSDRATTVGVVLSGGNLDPELAAAVFA